MTTDRPPPLDGPARAAAESAIRRWAAGTEMPGFFLQLDAPSAFRTFSTRLTSSGEIFEGEIGRPLARIGAAAREDIAALARSLAFADLASVAQPDPGAPAIALHVGLDTGAPFALWVEVAVFDATPWLRSVAYAIGRIAEKALASKAVAPGGAPAA